MLYGSWLLIEEFLTGFTRKVVKLPLFVRSGQKIMCCFAAISVPAHCMNLGLFATSKFWSHQHFVKFGSVLVLCVPAATQLQPLM